MRMPKLVCMLALLLGAPHLAQAEFANNAPAPVIVAQDIRGQEVNINSLVETEPYVVIIHFFSVATGEEVAQRLRFLDERYGKEKIQIIALGFREDEVTLRRFAEDLDIHYYIIDTNRISDATWMDSVDVLPMTLFVHPDPDLVITRVIKGGGRARAEVLRSLAESLYRTQQDPDMAVELADEAAKDPESTAEAREMKGYILASQGKLDEAEQEFGEIDSKTGLAAVAKERGDLEQAVALAEQAGDDPYAQVVKGQALMAQGRVVEAAAALEQAGEPTAEWQQSDVFNAQGRVQQELGNHDAAVERYQNAVAIDPLNVIALSNEGAAHRAKGDPESLQRAQELLETAASRAGNDQLVVAALHQVTQELRRAADVERRNLIRSQIQNLGERYREMQTDPDALPVDDWSSRPLVMAFLPSDRGTPVFFERAGTDVVLQRELEASLQQDGRVQIVEREMLDLLLQELDLGSSELASGDTQRRLGQVLSAGMLGFMDFAMVGDEKQLYLRAVDSETTGIVFQASQPINERQPLLAVQALTQKLLESFTADRELKGLVIEATSEDMVIINLGANHGVVAGQEFTVLEDDAPLEINGRIVAHRQRPVAKLTITDLEPEYAIGAISNKREGAEIARTMKVRHSR